VSASGHNISLNACFVSHGRVGGAEQLVVNLLDGLRDQVATGETWRVYSREPLVTTYPVDPLQMRVLHQAPAVNRMAFEALWLPREPRPDVWLHLNYFTPPMLRAPSVTVVYDVQYVHHPANFSRVKRTWLDIAHGGTARRADKIVAFSEHTAEDLIQLHGDNVADRIEVIPSPVSFDRLSASAELPAGVPPDRPYILGVAAHYRHKNLATLVEAHALLARTTDVALVLAGQSRDNLAGRGSATELDTSRGTPNVVVTGFVDDAVLGELYRHAAVFAFPSLFEGFGLPVVEALGLRVPTVTTRCAAIPEVGGTFPLYVDDPLSAAELAEALRSALQAPDLARPSVADAATMRAAYAPQAIAAQYATLLRSVR
jgi:glycosyltransferase involved in cell wall biosynthesis